MTRLFSRVALSALLAVAVLPAADVALAGELPGDRPDDWRSGLRLPGFMDAVLRGESLQDEPVLLQFWASWCRSCGQLMADLDDIAVRFPHVRYLAVSIDDDAAAARRRLKAHPLFPQYSDRFFHDADQQLSKRFDVVTVPTILIIDADGRERLRHSGHFNSTDLNRIVYRLADLEPASEGTSP
jgi:thiol-disulfide isomerase/thioredoxin